jgi:hypothetical protein
MTATFCSFEGMRRGDAAARATRRRPAMRGDSPVRRPFLPPKPPLLKPPFAIDRVQPPAPAIPADSPRRVRNTACFTLPFLPGADFPFRFPITEIPFDEILDRPHRPLGPAAFQRRLDGVAAAIRSQDGAIAQLREHFGKLGEHSLAHFCKEFEAIEGDTATVAVNSRRLIGGYLDAWGLTERLLKAYADEFEACIQSTKEKLSKVNSQIATFRAQLSGFAVDGLRQSKSDAGTLAESVALVSKKIASITDQELLTAAAVKHVHDNFPATAAAVGADLAALDRSVKLQIALSLENSSRELKKTSAVGASARQSCSTAFGNATGRINMQFTALNRTVRGLAQEIGSEVLSCANSITQSLETIQTEEESMTEELSKRTSKVISDSEAIFETFIKESAGTIHAIRQGYHGAEKGSGDVVRERETRAANRAALLAKFQHFQSAIVQECQIQSQYVSGIAARVRVSAQPLLEPPFSGLRSAIPAEAKLNEIEQTMDALETQVSNLRERLEGCAREVDCKLREVVEHMEAVRSEIFEKLEAMERRLPVRNLHDYALRQEVQALAHIAAQAGTERLEAVRKRAVEAADRVREARTGLSIQSFSIADYRVTLPPCEPPS